MYLLAAERGTGVPQGISALREVVLFLVVEAVALALVEPLMLKIAALVELRRLQCWLAAERHLAGQDSPANGVH